VVQSVRVDPPSGSPFSSAGVGDAADAEGADAEAVAGYWGLMLPARCPRRALLLGLGGGTVAALLARRCPGVALVGVERDEAVLALARAEFGLDAIPGLTVVIADAFADVAERAAGEPGGYDLICLDLYEGGRMAPGALATDFLRQLALLLAPDGILAVNLMRGGRLAEHLHRLGRVFAIERERCARGNLVVHCRALAGEDAPASA